MTIYYLLIDENNIVQNVINYDGTSDYTPPFGLRLITSEHSWSRGQKFIENSAAPALGENDFNIPLYDENAAIEKAKTSGILING